MDSGAASTTGAERGAATGAGQGAAAEPASSEFAGLEAAVLGTGIDLVHVPSFAADLARPGSTFAASVFTVRERAAANRRGLTGDALARHLAGRWAVKESVIKAWSQALYGAPPPIPRDELDWRDIEIVADAWGRVAVALHGRVRAAVAESLGPGSTDDKGSTDDTSFATPTSSPQERFHISISHDGDHAIAIAILAVH
ncbi:holo-ACP synthase [Corynebacterium sp. NPDC060344]|uniref:holo-ACP synthase AcpS n=1 Tax=Corynebacterium sp. NPDC060344 TaxID=3347101 RepID=UPI003662471B